MNALARKHILDVDPNTKINTIIEPYPKQIKYIVNSYEYSLSHRIIHEYNFREFEACSILAFWYNQYGKYEVCIDDAPDNITRRDYFLVMEKYGPVRRVTFSKTPGTAWIEFVHEISAKNAVGNVIFISEVSNFIRHDKYNKNIQFYKQN